MPPRMNTIRAHTNAIDNFQLSNDYNRQFVDEMSKIFGKHSGPKVIYDEFANSPLSWSI